MPILSKKLGLSVRKGTLVNQNPPVFSSPTSFSAAENQTAVGTVVAAGSTFAIVAGGDSASFAINTNTGVLTFSSAPDFETKSSYTVTIRATKGALTADQTITVTVTNVVEVPGAGAPITSSPITDTTMTVGATLDCKGLSTVWSIEYGLTSSYGSTQAGGTTSVNGAVSVALTGLTPYTLYHWRLKAVNSDGTTYTGDQTATTTEPAIILDGNTVGWYDFNVGITKDGSNFVSAWNSRIGANHLLQATGTNQPLHSASGVLFDGIDNFMKAASFTFNQPEFVYAVLKQASWTNGDVLFDGNTASSGRLFQRSTSPNLGISAPTNIGTDTNAIIGNYVIVRVLFNGASSSIQINANSKTSGDAGTNNMGGITIGASGANLVFSNVEIKEAIFRKVADNSTNEEAIYNYLKTKYAL